MIFIDDDFINRSEEPQELRSWLDSLRSSVKDEDLLGLKKIDNKQAESFLKKDLSKEEVDYVQILLKYSKKGKVYYPWAELLDWAMENLDSLKRLKFTTGGFFQGWYEFSLKFPQKDGNPNLKFRRPDFRTEKKAVGTVSVKELKDLLERVHFTDWESFYSRDDILDGSSWELDLKFRETEVSKIHISGVNDFPNDYSIFKEFFFSFLPDDMNPYCRYGSD